MVTNKKNIFKDKLRFYFKNHWTTPMKLFLIYILFIIIGGCLLYLPISLENGYYTFSPVIGSYGEYTKEKYSFLDAIFLAASAFTNTGLSITDVSQTFNFFGEFVLYIWIQIGGFGLLSLFYLIGRSLNKVFGEKISNNPVVGFVERGGSKISDNGKMLSFIFILILLVQLFFAFIFSFIIYSYEFNDVWVMDTALSSASAVEIEGTRIEGYNDYGIALWKGLFLSCSSINNAGFDLFGSYSIAIFRNGVGIIIQLMILFLFIFGGIGYICIYDIHRIISIKFWRNKTRLYEKIFKTKFIYSNMDKRISVTTKVCLWSALIVGFSSIVISFFSEYVSTQFNENTTISLVSEESLKTYFDNSWFNTNFSILFNSLSTRSAGYSTINCDQLQASTKWIFIVLMYIGTSPASTGGGIRTTTLAVIIKAFSQKITNIDNPQIQKRRIPKRMVIEAFQISTMALIMILSFSIFSMIFNDFESSFTKVIFEMASAFGTTGLSTGITSQFNSFSMVLIIILMFVGQLGITNTLTTFSGKYTQGKVNGYPNIEMKIG